MTKKIFGGITPASYKGGFWCLVAMVLFLGSFEGEAQIVKHYANQVTFQSHVANATNASNNTTLTDFATLESYGGVALGIGAYTGELELQFPSTLPAGTTSYVKIDFDPALLDALLGGNLGDVLAGLLGTVLLGDHFFNVEARMGGTTVLSGSSNNGLGTDELKLIVDPAGNYLLAITPSSAYDRIYIEDDTNALLLGTTNSMDVYYAYYTTGQDPCESAFATSFDGSGGTLGALGLGNAGVENPEYAIDSNDATYSELSMGLLTVAGSLSQTIYFQSLADASDEYHLRIRTSTPALLGLGLADGIKIEAFNGANMVSQVALSTLLGIDLLGILNSGQVADISFSPGVPFDRIKITISSLVQLNLTKKLEIYGVYRSPAPPTNPWGSASGPIICYDAMANLMATTTNTNDLVWYADEFGGMPLATTPYNGTFVTNKLTTDTTFYVAVERTGCNDASSRIPVLVTVQPYLNNATVTMDNIND